MLHKARAVLAGAILALPLLSQTSGEINGVVTDSSGSIVAGARVAVTNPDTNYTRETTTNQTGNYAFPNLLPGLYNVQAELEGFQTAIRPSVELQVQQTARIDFQLSVGAITETVEVTGGAPLINTEDATVGTVIENKRILDLPLNGRSFVSLISLSPNVTTGQTSNTGWTTLRGNKSRGDVSISISGLRREYTYYTLDGVSNSDVDFNAYSLLPSPDALLEFKVQTGIYSAEFGREAAQVNISTKSGTNQYHGTVFEFLRNDKLDARPYSFTASPPPVSPFKWNQFGFTLSGPVPGLFGGRDRLFFMSNYEGFRLNSEFPRVFSVPSPAMKRGDFSEILPDTVIRDFLNGDQPFPGNIIPDARLSNPALALLEFYPDPNVPGAGLVNNLVSVLYSKTMKDQFTQRIDFVESAASNWYGRYSWQAENDNSTGNVLSALRAGDQTTGDVSTNVKQAMIGNTRILSPTFLNEFRFGYSGYNNDVLSVYAYKRNIIGDAGIKLYFDLPPVNWGVPLMLITGFSNFGDNYNAPYVLNNHTFQWVDNVSWTHGGHSVKFGAEIRRDRYNAIGGQVSNGYFSIQGNATGYGFADYMIGQMRVSSATAILGVGRFRATSQSYYVNDNWRITPTLSLQAGLRYEFIPPWNSVGDNMSNIIAPVTNPSIVTPGPHPLDQHPYMARNCAAFGQTEFQPPSLNFIRFDPAIQQRCVDGPGTSLVQSDYTNFAPRIGLAWSPTDNWVVRGGVGVFYVQDQGNTYFDAALDLSGKSLNVSQNYNLTLEDPLDLAQSNPCGTQPPFVCIKSPILLGNDPNRRTPYLVQYTFNIQRQLTQSTAIEVGYLGSSGRRLQRPVIENEAFPGAEGSSASRLPFPEFSLLQITKSASSSNYNSATLKLTRRLSAGLSFLLGYTYSKSLDDGSAIRAGNASVTSHPQTGWCVECEYGLSDFDSRQRLVISTLYELPFGNGKPMLNRGIGSAILGNWQVNSIISKSSGFPIMLLDGINRSNTSLSNNRPDAVLNVLHKLDNPTTQEWFDIRSVRLQPFGQYGNLGRNTAIGPGVFAWDFSALKNFNFTESTYLQFRFECFNCANHPVWGDPANRLSANRIDADGFAVPGTGTFGVISDTRAGIFMRQLQFSLKFNF